MKSRHSNRKEGSWFHDNTYEVSGTHNSRHDWLSSCSWYAAYLHREHPTRRAFFDDTLKEKTKVTLTFSLVVFIETDDLIHTLQLDDFLICHDVHLIKDCVVLGHILVLVLLLLFREELAVYYKKKPKSQENETYIKRFECLIGCKIWRGRVQRSWHNRSQQCFENHQGFSYYLALVCFSRQ